LGGNVFDSRTLTIGRRPLPNPHGDDVVPHHVR
jgi:hypothetical protein